MPATTTTTTGTAPVATVLAVPYKKTAAATVGILFGKGKASEKVAGAQIENLDMYASRWVMHGENPAFFAVDGEEHWKKSATKLGKALQAFTKFVRDYKKANGKPRTQDDHDSFCVDALAVFDEAMNAGAVPVSKTDDEKRDAALKSAIKTLSAHAVYLTGEQCDTLAQALETARAILAAQSAPATSKSARKSARKPAPVAA